MAEAADRDVMTMVTERPARRYGSVSHFVSSTDGLRLHALEYGDRVAPRLPVVCLPGLARNAGDFHALALALANDDAAPRRVVAIDYRGRGLSDYDHHRNYTLEVELGDVEAVLAALGLGPALFVGTSRGGLITMLMGAVHPTRIAGVVLNDIGPVIEPQGLMRIKAYVGKLQQPRDFADGAEILRKLFGGQFPALEADDWLASAYVTWRQERGKLVLNYDARIARTLDPVDLEAALPPLWDQFDTLANVPMLLIRGALTELLSPATVAAMRERRQSLDVVEVEGQGHPPNLGTPELVRRIGAFARACDAAWR